jgi:site-specific DNA recombinase
MEWRRERDSNPRYGFPYTRVPGVRLKPLGHLSS